MSVTATFGSLVPPGATKNENPSEVRPLLTGAVQLPGAATDVVEGSRPRAGRARKLRGDRDKRGGQFYMARNGTAHEPPNGQLGAIAGSAESIALLPVGKSPSDRAGTIPAGYCS